MTSRPATKVLSIAAFGVALACALAVADPPTSTWLGHALLTAAPLTAALAAITASRRIDGHLSRPWRLVGIACALWGIGAASWAMRTAFHLDAIPPQLMHIPYLAAFPFFVMSALAVSHDEEEHSVERRLLDGTILALSIFLISWAFLIGELWSASGRDILARVLGLVYPVGDLFVLALVAFVSMRIAPPRTGRLLLVGLGVVSIAIADSVFAYLQLTGSYRTGDPIDAGYVMGFLLVAVAGSIGAREPGARHGFDLSRVRVHLPYVVAGLAAAVIVPVQIHRGVIDPVLFVGSVALMLLVISRQFQMVNENHSAMVRQLEQIVNMRTGILRAVSHELRTPLTVIQGTATFLQDAGDEVTVATRQELMSQVSSSADRLEQMLSGLLDLERLTRGTIELRRERVSMQKMILAVAETIDLNGHRFRLSPSDAEGNIDRAHAERIVENLLVNAARHTPSGTEITVSTDRVDDGVAIVVEDQGPGIPADEREHVFEPFAQLQEQQRGAGVGLSLVASYATLHGGRAWVEDSPRGGARFCVWLPDHVADAS